MHVSFLWILPLLYFVRFTALYLCYTSLLVLLYYNVPSAEPTHSARLQVQVAPQPSPGLLHVLSR